MTKPIKANTVAIGFSDSPIVWNIVSKSENKPNWPRGFIKRNSLKPRNEKPDLPLKSMSAISKM